MAKAIRLLFAAVVVSACGGGSPTGPSISPFGSESNACIPQTAQCLLDAAVIGVTVNGVDVAAFTTQMIPSVSSLSLRFSYSNMTRQNLWIGFLFTRDDGVELFTGCLGVDGLASGGTITLTGQSIQNDPTFTPGHTVRASIVGMFGPPPQGQCALRTSTGAFNRDVVQAQLLLVTFVVQ